MWKYAIIDTDEILSEGIEEMMNELGKDDWEAFYIDTDKDRIYFRKKIEY